MSTNRHEFIGIDDTVRGLQKLQAEVRTTFAKVTELQKKQDENKTDMDDFELKELEDAKRALPAAKLQHQAATLRLKIADSDPAGLQIKEWRKDLEPVGKQINSGELLTTKIKESVKNLVDGVQKPKA